jgi:hypothetical protein
VSIVDPFLSARLILFRFFDLEAKFGRTYRYRIKLIYVNPAFQAHDVPDKVSQGEMREGPWSEPSPAVLVGKSTK